MKQNGTLCMMIIMFNLIYVFLMEHIHCGCEFSQEIRVAFGTIQHCLLQEIISSIRTKMIYFGLCTVYFSSKSTYKKNKKEEDQTFNPLTLEMKMLSVVIMVSLNLSYTSVAVIFLQWLRVSLII